MVDVKLIALQAGTFGRAFAARFAPLTLLVAMAIERAHRMVVALSAAGGTISLLIGAVLLRLTFTGTYSRYVRIGMGPWLAVAGVAVVLLGLATLLRALLRPHATDADVHDHGANRVGWLLLAPIAALLLVAPPTLGSYGVGRGATVDVRAGAPVFDALRRRHRAGSHDAARVRPAGVRAWRERASTERRSS